MGESTCEEAAFNGHVSTLRWLQEHGCPWDAIDICASAAQGGSVDVLVYLQQQGIESTAEALTQMLKVAGANNHLAAAQWLRQQGASWPAKLCSFRQWSGDTLAWARAEGCTSPTA
jgi:tripartite-type tricarboxylate transporter receptor subunit TctC